MTKRKKRFGRGRDAASDQKEPATSQGARLCGVQRRRLIVAEHSDDRTVTVVQSASFVDFLDRFRIALKPLSATVDE